MIRLERTNAANPDFHALVRQLDAYLAVKDGEQHAFYDQYNQLDTIPQVLVAYAGEKAVGCGALKPFAAETMEIKRMFVLPAFRGQGIAAMLVTGLEIWAAELGARTCVLETGRGQTEAVQLYKKCGYEIIPNYGPYAGIANSICFKKTLPCT